MFNFAEHLKSLRLSRGITQKQLGEAIGSSERGIQNYELGVSKPKYEMMIALADYFDVSLDYLTGRKNYWQDSDGTMHAEVTPGILNLDTDELKKKLNQPTEPKE